MAVFRPFAAVRPLPDYAAQVAALPYDVMSSAEARELAQGNPNSFLHVDKAEIDLDPSIDLYDARVYEKARGTPSLSGMGTTVVCALVRGGLAQYVHVGDSRIYLFRNNKLLQLTKDHSMVQEMVEQGALTEEEAQNHPRKNLITRALGVGRDVEADFGEKEVSPRDILLLCSDGLSNCVSVPQIEETLARTPFYEAADALVQKALEGGGLDNITVLLMQVEAVEENNG